MTEITLEQELGKISLTVIDRYLESIAFTCKFEGIDDDGVMGAAVSLMRSRKRDEFWTCVRESGAQISPEDLANYLIERAILRRREKQDPHNRDYVTEYSYRKMLEGVLRDKIQL